MANGRLFELAGEQTKRIIEGDWSVPITLTDSNGNTAIINGLITRHSKLWSPENQEFVTDVNAHFSVIEKTLADTGLNPRNTESGLIEMEDWVVEFEDNTNTKRTYTINYGEPDETVGLIKVMIKVAEIE